jgi:transglutaminase/protease-like cytokinesis protein 3
MSSFMVAMFCSTSTCAPSRLAVQDDTKRRKASWIGWRPSGQGVASLSNNELRNIVVSCQLRSVKPSHTHDACTFTIYRVSRIYLVCVPDSTHEHREKEEKEMKWRSSNSHGIRVFIYSRSNILDPIMVQYTAANMQNPSKRLQRKEKKKKKRSTAQQWIPHSCSSS